MAYARSHYGSPVTVNVRRSRTANRSQGFGDDTSTATASAATSAATSAASSSDSGGIDAGSIVGIALKAKLANSGVCAAKGSQLASIISTVVIGIVSEEFGIPPAILGPLLSSFLKCPAGRKAVGDAIGTCIQSSPNYTQFVSIMAAIGVFSTPAPLMPDGVTPDPGYITLDILYQRVANILGTGLTIEESLFVAATEGNTRNPTNVIFTDYQYPQFIDNYFCACSQAPTQPPAIPLPCENQLVGSIGASLPVGQTPCQYIGSTYLKSAGANVKAYIASGGTLRLSVSDLTIAVNVLNNCVKNVAAQIVKAADPATYSQYMTPQGMIAAGESPLVAYFTYYEYEVLGAAALLALVIAFRNSK